ncbi:MAG: ribonuclease E inhibitor RraB [Acidimicrobiales bacterium]|nr:ribonuclease E inhibitor RraB [Acidimicrobiales bacterium]
MLATVEDGWRLYPITRYDVPGTVMVSAELLERAPLGDCPVAVIASLAIEGDPPSSRIVALEEALVSQIEAAGGAYAGHLRSSVELLSIAYVPVRPARADEWEAGWTDLVFFDDPEWSFLDEFLRPDEAEAQSEGDLKVWATLFEQGDDGREPRPVDHQASFSESRAAEAFIDEVRADGFMLTDSTTNPGHVLVQVTRHDPVVAPPGGISEIVGRVREAAERHGGSHVGWGAPIVRTRRRWWRRNR